MNSFAVARWRPTARPRAVATAARGSDVDFMSGADIEEKLRSAAMGWEPKHDVAPLIEAIRGLGNNADISLLLHLSLCRGCDWVTRVSSYGCRPRSGNVKAISLHESVGGHLSENGAKLAKNQ
jgi:hypothetical protein